MSAYKKVVYDIAAVASGDLNTISDIANNSKFIIPKGLIKGHYIRISFFAKPVSGTMTPKFRLAFKNEIFIDSSLGVAKWAKGGLITPKDEDGNIIAVSDTTNGETIALSPILIDDFDIAVLLEDCEEDGQLIVVVERVGGGLI